MKPWNLGWAGACALITGVTSVPVLADCHWEWLCSGDGGCKQMPVCDTLYEIAPPRPDSAPPTPPPISMRPQQIPASLGPATCEFVLRQTRNGRWQWDRACFCSDRAKTVDPDAPLANIVRCEPPWKE